MNVQETQIFNSEEQIEKPRRGNTWFAMLFALLSIPLIIIGIGLLVFASITIAGVVLLILTILLLVLGFSLLITAGVYLVNSTERVEAITRVIASQQFSLSRRWYAEFWNHPLPSPTRT